MRRPAAAKPLSGTSFPGASHADPGQAAAGGRKVRDSAKKTPLANSYVFGYNSEDAHELGSLRDPTNVPMIHAPANHARTVTAHLAGCLNAGHAKPKFAVCGSVALHLHGVPVSRPVGDIDIVALDPIGSAAGLRRLLVDVGCAELASQRTFAKLIREGCVSFVLDGLTCEILSQHDRAAAAPPTQAEAARNVIAFTRENLRLIDGVPVLDIDAIVVWQALFDRTKDHAAIAELVAHQAPDGKPVIRDRDKVLDLVIANKSKHADVVKLLQQTLWHPWHSTYR